MFICVQASALETVQQLLWTLLNLIRLLPSVGSSFQNGEANGQQDADYCCCDLLVVLPGLRYQAIGLHLQCCHHLCVATDLCDQFLHHWRQRKVQTMT